MPLELLELEKLLVRMETLARRAPTEWERTFARSVLRQAKKPSWRPSARQEHVMLRMEAEFLRGPETAPVLIEVEEARASA